MRRRILDASLRVLREEGALAFTTTRVAQVAGVSVGSLYQYFPNKHALVAALHEQDVREGLGHVLEILARAEIAPRERVHEIVRWFFETEAAEAATFGAANGDIEVFLRDGASAALDASTNEAAVRVFAEFLAVSTTADRPVAGWEDAARFAITTVEAIGKALAAQHPTPEMVQGWADRTAAMLADHLGFAP